MKKFYIFTIINIAFFFVNISFFINTVYLFNSTETERSHLPSSYSMPFMPSVWKNKWEMSPENPRGFMLKDLLKNHLKKGMTSEKVLDILGVPDEDYSNGEKLPASKGFSWKYNVGALYDGSIDSWALFLNFDGNKKIDNFNIVQY